VAAIVGCALFTRQDPCNAYMVASHHYEALRDQLDRKERGWVELDCPEGEGGKTLIRLEDIVVIVLQTESLVEAVRAREAVSG
jgi:hypothetical protein